VIILIRILSSQESKAEMTFQIVQLFRNVRYHSIRSPKISSAKSRFSKRKRQLRHRFSKFGTKKKKKIDSFSLLEHIHLKSFDIFHLVTPIGVSVRPTHTPLWKHDPVLPAHPRLSEERCCSLYWQQPLYPRPPERSQKSPHSRSFRNDHLLPTPRLTQKRKPHYKQSNPQETPTLLRKAHWASQVSPLGLLQWQNMSEAR
jgi:hypothetical protein